MRNSFLQTHQWLEFQKAVGHQAWRFDNDRISANIIRHNLPLGKSYLYVPHGPEIMFNEIEGGLKHEIVHFFEYMRKIAQSAGAMFVKFEPLHDTVAELIYEFGLRKSNKDIQPHKSVILDLTPSEDQLLSQMHHKTRYNIKVAERHGIAIRQSDDIELFWKLLEKTAKRDKFYSHTKDYYKKLLEMFNGDGALRTDLFIAFHSEQPIAGAIVLRHEHTGYYLHGASDHEFRNMMAPYALHWDIIKYLKGRGIQSYDFWGIDAQRWPGVTRFKLGWGGTTVEYPGAFDLPISKFWYFAYNLARKIR